MFLIALLLSTRFLCAVICEVPVNCYENEILLNYNRELLNRTNFYRARHFVDFLTLDHELMINATEYTRELASQQRIHPPSSPSEGTENGRNFSWPFSSDKIRPTDNIDYWYSLAPKGKPNKMVSRSFAKLGCAHCATTYPNAFGLYNVYITCRYAPGAVTPSINTTTPSVDITSTTIDTTPPVTPTTPSPPHNLMRLLVEILIIATAVTCLLPVTFAIVLIIYAK